ncbi:Oidioi.mRNA.OKI2018_I69.chr1.g1667.t1.cds [Oikopleura dioica]|uniref:Oidioi.mRNA.OKI2018_I69.chr1.g1667.t1.cds n=1 Tax=Oikopleura dioica TaxID=34765 RepID=A0ABN7SQA3_OIKDI|nr:Oidioi.mRNA.OKI2018_I69.chr1.g1667.t1.cds [Oikopleura dioica]
MDCEEKEEDTRPIAFRVEINEETREHFLKYARESGLDKIKPEDDYFSTSDEEEHAPGDSRNLAKQIANHFDGILLRPHKTKCDKFLDYYQVYDAESLIEFIPEDEFGPEKEPPLKELCLEAAKEAAIENKERWKAEKLRKNRERKRERRRKEAEMKMQLAENFSGRIVDQDVEMADEMDDQPAQNFVEMEDEEMVSDSRKG